MSISVLASMIVDFREQEEGGPVLQVPEDADSVLRAKLVQRVVRWAEESGQQVLAAMRQGLTEPEPVRSEAEDRTATPDAVARSNGVGMLYAVQTGQDLEEPDTAGRLRVLASHAFGQVMLFVLAVPRGFGGMAKRRVRELGIDAQVLELDV